MLVLHELQDFFLNFEFADRFSISHAIYSAAISKALL
jgi:hypothetical protein